MLVNDLRPRRLDEFYGNSGILNILKNNLMRGAFPQLVAFTGLQGTGKSTLAELIGLSLTCENRQGYDPCLTCEACRSTLGSNFASLCVRKFNMAELLSKRDTLEVVKEIFHFENIKDTAVYILEEMHAVPLQSQTAFLEYFTNVPDNVYIFICTNQRGSLLPAMLNRCIVVELGSPAPNECRLLIDRICETLGIACTAVAGRKLTRLCACNPRALVTFFELFKCTNKIEEQHVETYFNSKGAEVDLLWASLMDEQITTARFARVVDSMVEKGGLVAAFRGLQSRFLEYLMEDATVVEDSGLSSVQKGKIRAQLHQYPGICIDLLNILKDAGDISDAEEAINYLMRCKLTVIMKLQRNSSIISRDAAASMESVKTNRFSDLGLVGKPLKGAKR